MARTARFNIFAIADLLEQLRYAPTERRRHDLVAAEAFLNEIVVDQNYPEDFVVYRITEYRPEISEPALLVGRALCGDLALFIERLSHSLALRVADYEPRVALSSAEAAARFAVSNSTLHRYRKLGLVAHQLVWPDGKMRLGFFEDAIVNFENRHAVRVKRARDFEQMSETEKARLLRRARRYQGTLGYSRQQITHRLSRRFGRSAEAVRQLLKRHDAQNPAEAIFKSRPQFGVKERNILLRAADVGVPMSQLTARFARTRPTLYRAIHQARAARLRAWKITYIALPTFTIAEAGEFLLASAVVREGFVPGGAAEYFGFGSAADWVATCEQTALEVPAATETAWFGALNYLLAEAVRERAQFDRYHASAQQLDAVETNLRWAAALKERIMAANLRTVLATLEIHLGQRLLDAERAEVRALQRLGIKILAHSVDQFDPARGQRFGALLSFNLRRGLARLPSAGSPDPAAGALSGKARAKRIGRRHEGLMLTGGRTATNYPWQLALTFSTDRAALILKLRANSGRTHAAEVVRSGGKTRNNANRFEILTARYGLAGSCPLTCSAVGEEFGMTAEQVAAAEARGIRQLRQLGAAQIENE